MSFEDEIPLVSVVIPCYNQGQYVEQAVESVLASDFQRIEIIVVNDGSTDPLTAGTLHRLQKPKTRVIHQANQGLPSARNTGVRESLGRYFLPLDADDQIDPAYLGKGVRVLEEEPRLGFVFPYTVTFGQRRLVWKRAEYNLYRELWRNQIPISSLVRKAAWEDAGGYSPNMTGGYEDWDFWISLGERGWFGRLLPEPLFYYRTRSGSMISSALARHDELVQRLRRNHPDTFFNPPRLRQLKREWGIPAIDVDWWKPMRRIGQARWFPTSIKRLIRPLPKDMRLIPTSQDG